MAAMTMLPHPQALPAWNNRTLPVCNECRDPRAYMLADHHTGDHVCSSCGVVSARLYAQDQEWRQYSDSPTNVNLNRVGTAEDPTLCASMQTLMAGAQGVRRTLGRNLAKTAEEKADQRQMRVNALISKVVERMGLTERVVTEAKRVSKIARCTDIRRVHPEVAACVHMACRRLGIAVKMDIVCAMTGLETSRLAWKAQGMIERASKRREAQKTSKRTIKEHTSPTTSAFSSRMQGFPRRAAEALGLAYADGTTVERLCHRMASAGVLEGTRPSTIAAAVAWLVLERRENGPQMTRRQACVELGLSESALRRACSMLQHHVDQWHDAESATTGVVQGGSEQTTPIAAATDGVDADSMIVDSKGVDTTGTRQQSMQAR